MTLRTIWDMSFQFIFLYILIAIITGPLPSKKGTTCKGVEDFYQKAS